MCANVIEGRFDRSKPFFTSQGSFWTHSTTEFLAGESEAGCTLCNAAGIESLALIPLRAGGEFLGLLQLNDRRKGMFSADHIASWERLADQLAIALAKCRAEEKVARVASFPLRNPNPVVEADLEGRVCFVNPAAKNLFPDLEERGPDHPWLAGWAAVAAKCQDRGGTLPDRELRVGESWFYQSMHFVEDTNRIRIYAFDVTARKEAEQALFESREDLNRAQAVAHTGSWRLNVRRNELLWSDESHRIFGIPQGTPLTYETFLATIHPDDKEYVDQKWRAALEGVPYDIEHRIVVGDAEKWVRERAELEFDADGALLGGFGTVQDITLRKRTEQALQESEHRFRTVVESNMIGVVFADAVTGEVTDANDEYLRIIGRSRAELEAGCINWKAITSPETLEYEEQLSATMSRDELLVPFDKTYIQPDGTRVPVILGGSFIDDERRSLVAFVLDITERKRADQALRRTAEELERSNTDLEQFANVASHDLQEPLRTISGFLKLLQDRYEAQLDDRAREYIRHAVTGAGRMSQLVSDLLAYSRVQRHGRKLESTDANHALATVLVNLRSSIEECSAEITHDNLPVIKADRTQFMQLLQNLIGNAIKFRQDGKQPRIHVGAVSREGDWVFSVRDNGIGIPQNQFDRIFMIFQRLHTREAYPGTGIGLAICKRIVHRHGGRIWVESTPGGGSTFFFTLGNAEGR
jgi:PAS domain S-box-containing protein